MPRTWSKPKPVSLDEIPGRTTAGLHDEWIADVVAQLEQNEHTAICYPFVSEKQAIATAKHGMAALRRHIGKGTVRSRRDGNNLYVWPGPNWPQRKRQTEPEGEE